MISAAAHKNLHKLLRHTYRLAAQQRRAAKQSKAKPKVPTITLADDPNAWWVEKKRTHFVVRGQRLEGFARRTDFKNPAALERLRDIFHKQGVDRELVRLGVKVGGKVEIARKTLEW